MTRDTVSERRVLDFDDASHCYMIRENSGKLRALSGSVTFLASQLARDFDAAAVLQRMRNGKAMFVTPCMAQSFSFQLDVENSSLVYFGTASCDSNDNR